MSRVLSLLLVLAPLPAAATLAEALALEDLAVRATDIVQGRVLEVQGRRAGGLIVSDVAVAVAGCFKGTCQDAVVTVRVLGGRAEGLTMRVFGAPRFEPDEDVLLFLEPGADDALRVVGLAQGKLRLLRGGDDLLVARDLDDLQLTGRPAEGLDRVRLGTLVDRLERILDLAYPEAP